MPSYNVQAAGQVIRVNFNRDISTGTVFSMELEPRAGQGLTKIATLGTVDVVVDDETYLASQYIEYTTEAGIFEDLEGRWRKKGIATLPSEIVASDYSFFRVMP
jgi:hypothetical protein